MPSSPTEAAPSAAPRTKAQLAATPCRLLPAWVSLAGRSSGTSDAALGDVAEPTAAETHTNRKTGAICPDTAETSTPTVRAPRTTSTVASVRKYGSRWRSDAAARPPAELARILTIRKALTSAIEWSRSYSQVTTAVIVNMSPRSETARPPISRLKEGTRSGSRSEAARDQGSRPPVATNTIMPVRINRSPTEIAVVSGTDVG